MGVTSDMSDDDSSEESGNRRELEKARVADTPNEDPTRANYRGSSG